MKNVSFILVLSALFLAFGGTAQNAVLTGKIVKIENGQEVPVEFAKVLLLKADSTVFRGTTTDFDGVFKIIGIPGPVLVSFRQSGLREITMPMDLVLGDNAPLNITMESPIQDIKGDFTVIAYRTAPSTVAGDDNRRKEASNATDGMTKEQMKATGDANAGDAVQRVPGVSVQGGKYVFVRGLGDRYTKTILNGVEIPGLDPDRNTVQLDIFPTALIENITVYKTFSPDLSGDFTGGLLDIITKDAPTKKELSINAGLGYNSVTTFNKNFLTYKGGKLDYLGMDDGSRALPISPTAKTPDPSQMSDLTYKYTNAFGKTMAPTNGMALPNHTYGLSYGNQFSNIFKKPGLDYGYVLAANYRSNNQNYQDVEFGNYQRSQNTQVTELEIFRNAKGNISENEVLWTGVFNQSLKVNQKTKISLGLFHTQNGVKSASNIRENNVEGNQAVLIKQNLQYTQRRVTNLDLKGSHNMTKWKIKWNIAPTMSNISDPDIRSTVLEEITTVNENGDSTTSYELNPASGSQIRRIYRNLDEKSFNSKLNFSYDFFIRDSIKSTFSFGAANLVKKRDFSVNDYFFELVNTTETSLDPNFYFQKENLWTKETNKGTYVKGQKEPANQYSGTQMISALYVMNELPITSKLKATYGARAEKADNYYTGRNNDGTVRYKNENVLNEFDILPSISLLYALKDKEKLSNQTNYRVSASKTVARPSFREKSIAQIYDPILGRTFNGNILLAQTTIYNADFRWEKFFGRTELISASAFYKKFYNPIEIATYEQAPQEVTPVNAGEADVYGLELEVRKAIGFTGEANEHINFTVGTNLNYVVSRIDMTKVLVQKGEYFISEYDNRKANVRGDEQVSRYRAMYGQSPYSINTFATFINTKLGVTLNCSYNVQGPRLTVVGVGIIPDVYEQPFHSLNLKASKSFGKDQQWVMSLSGQNLLNNTKREYYVAPNAQKQVYYKYKPGIQSSFTLTYKIK